jgi:hypothetical protein
MSFGRSRGLTLSGTWGVSPSDFGPAESRDFERNKHTFERSQTLYTH